ncbi:hypothetical protein R1sor_008722 [Riccia sorocarpa]|uniref:Uncharacterized protein n=1 Tax=Riccia sorocarpa TaxID=122646 RepID=A0ABD3HVW7_9MARC
MVKRVWSTGNLLQKDNRGVGLNHDGIDDLEKLCRQFLWGWSDDGTPKSSLIAWERLAQARNFGGMGWVPLKVKAQALQVRRVVQIITGENTEWIQLARSLVLRTLRRGQYQRDRVQWKTEDGIILSPINKVRGSKLLSRRGIFMEEVDNVRLQQIEEWVCSKELVGKKLHEAAGWRWRDNVEAFKWEQPTKFWIGKLLLAKDFSEYLNGKWGITDSQQSWARR